MSSFHENIPEPSTGRKVLKVTTAGQTYEEVQEEKRNSSKGALWRMASPSASREGSAHGGNLFGMKRDASFGDLWKWVSKPTASNAPSREGSQRGGSVFSKEFSPMKDGSTPRKEGIGTQIWAWATSQKNTPAPSREGSAHGGNLFGGSKKQEGSAHGGNLFGGSKSREGSAHGGDFFGGMRRNMSFSGLWNWKSDSGEEDQRKVYGGPDISTFQSNSPTAKSPVGMRPKSPAPGSPDQTHKDRGV